MTRTRLWVLASAGLLALALLAAAGFIALRGSTAPTAIAKGGADVVARGIVACEGAGPDTHGDAFESCLDGVWRQAVDAGFVFQAARAFADAEKRTPVVWTICHRVGHRTGAYAVDQGGDVDRLLAQGSGTYCGGGFAHGVLDEVAKKVQDSGDDTLLDRAVASCNKLTVREHSYNCSHGLGHSAFQAHHDVASAIRWCSKLDVRQNAAVCSGGVTMQAFSPDTVGDRDTPTFAPSDAGTLVPLWCKAASDTYGEHAPVTDGCYTYGAEALGDEAGEIISAFTEAQNGGDPVDITFADAAAVLSTAIARCDEFPADRRDLCRAYQAASVRWYTSQITEWQNQFCGTLDADIQGYCRGEKILPELTGTPNPSGAEPAPAPAPLDPVNQS